MSQRKVRITIEGTLFLDDEEIMDTLDDPNLPERENDAIAHLVHEKMGEMFPTDDPFKYNDVQVHSST